MVKRRSLKNPPRDFCISEIVPDPSQPALRLVSDSPVTDPIVNFALRANPKTRRKLSSRYKRSTLKYGSFVTTALVTRAKSLGGFPLSERRRPSTLVQYFVYPRGRY